MKVMIGIALVLAKLKHDCQPRQNCLFDLCSQESGETHDQYKTALQKIVTFNPLGHTRYYEAAWFLVFTTPIPGNANTGPVISHRR